MGRCCNRYGRKRPLTARRWCRAWLRRMACCSPPPPAAGPRDSLSRIFISQEWHATSALSFAWSVEWARHLPCPLHGV
eukprot:scaffold17103_cov154-Isochrysis_galbana.AAC.4